MNLRAGSAGPGIAHGPEVVLLAHAQNALLGNPDLVAPDVEGLVVVAKDRNPEFFHRQPHLPGQELPAEGDRFAFEVVAEGEVAEHFEKGVVAGGAADVFQVVVLAAGADAFLRGGGAYVVALLSSQKQVLELVHPRVGEEQGGVVLRHEAGAGHKRVAAGLEVVQEGLANLVTGPRFGHGFSSLSGQLAAPVGIGDASSAARMNAGIVAERTW